MKIIYKIIKYFDCGTPTEVGIYEIDLADTINFNSFIEIIKEKHIEDKKFHQIYVEDLVEKTWSKIISEGLINEMGIDSYHYEWLNYKLEDIAKMFNLFNEPINIIIDGPGAGRLMGEEEGIKFIIHSDEKDKHANNPHVHCEYSGETIFIYLKDIKLLNNKGFKNKRKTKVALKWVEKYRNDLLNYWNTIIKNDANIDFEINI